MQFFQHLDGAYSFPVMSDLTGDGSPDVVYQSASSSSMFISVGNGDGTFAPAEQVKMGPASKVVFADFDLNGTQDLVVEFGNPSDFVYLMLNSGKWAMNAPGLLPIVDFPLAMSGGTVLGDFNEDGKPDIVRTAVQPGFKTYQAVTLAGDGKGGFGAPIWSGPFQQTWFGLAADFDGDGHLDVATDSGAMSGRGDGTFRAPVHTGIGGDGFASGDFNGDGQPDLISWDSQSKFVRVFLNTSK